MLHMRFREARKFLRRGKFEEAAKVMDKATKDAGYEQMDRQRPFGVEFPRLHPGILGDRTAY